MADYGNGFDKDKLEGLYNKYNKREYVHPDPLEYLYRYPEIEDREIVALIASSLAYGKVEQILKSVARVLDVLGKSPHRYVMEIPKYYMKEELSGFRHRFNTGADIVEMIDGVKNVTRKYSSLNGCFSAGLKKGCGVMDALEFFVSELSECSDKKANFLLPSPSGGSACKRLNLFLRWMVRSDDVDPGGWKGVNCADLVVPLDTHMYRNCRMLGLTSRKNPDMKTAIEVTEAFRRIAPEDPVRYDFVISRMGIRKDVNFQELLD